jgi:hypothetical protein
MSEAIHVDVLIFGGGVAGLWTLARLRREGYSCVLVESKALGSGQTIASQGIIHGGIKYALTGEPGAASKAIAAMPEIWRACLEGRGEIDLRGVKVLSEKQYLWTTPGIGSRLAGVAASRVIRTAVRSVPQGSRVPPFDVAPRGVDVYEVEEPILDPGSVVAGLAASQPILRWVVDPETGAHFSQDREQRWRVGLSVAVRGDTRAADETIVEFEVQTVVLCAGEGNAQLMSETCGHKQSVSAATVPRMQTRPLHMVMVRAEHAREALPMIYGHCVGMSDKPRVTITSQSDASGRVVWYIGGQIAESGVQRSRDEQIKAAQDELRACIPWVNLDGTQWATLRVNRAEGIAGESGARPDGPVVQQFDGVIAAWPTKLAFAPLTASLVHDRLLDMGVHPSGKNMDQQLLSTLAPPSVADLPWNDGSTTWT